jgi:hypothetical protein
MKSSSPLEDPPRAVGVAPIPRSHSGSHQNSFLRPFLTFVLAVVVLGGLVLFGAASLGERGALAEHPGDPPAIILAGVNNPAEVAVSYLAFDREKNEPVVGYDTHRQYRSASVVKLLIALDFLEQSDSVSAVSSPDLDRLRLMLQASDDAAASFFWGRVGGVQMIDRQNARIGLTETDPPTDPGMWGFTEISATDIVTIYRYILDSARPDIRDFILTNLHQSTTLGTDGFNQSFGIPSLSLSSTPAVKQGWSGYGGASTANTHCGDLCVLHTSGLVGADDRFIVVVLTQQSAGTRLATAVSAITTLTAEVYHRASQQS